MMHNNDQIVDDSPPNASVDWIASVTFDSFTALILEHVGPVAVEFMSYGCGHCRAIERLLQQIAGELQSTEKMFRVNIAVEKELAENFDITGTPTLIMFLQGEEVGRVEGPSPNLKALQMALTSPFLAEDPYNEYVSSN
jgi:thioredoxin 1